MYDSRLIAKKLRNWESYLDSYHLPIWEHIPDIGLYMEQVISLLKGYLDYLPPELKEEQFITAATINNYVRKKIMPEPEKKKYYRIHIAYLIMICTLKHCLSIPTLQTLIPPNLEEEELKVLYISYSQRHRMSVEYFVSEVRKIAEGILDYEMESILSTDKTEELIMTSAVLSGLNRVLSEKLLLLNDKTDE